MELNVAEILDEAKRPSWYGIAGIEFHFNGPWADPEITYCGVRDSSNVIVEGTMWERYEEDGGADPHDGFEDYMRENAEEVYMLIEMARGELEL